MEPILRIRQDIRQAARAVASIKDPDAALLFCYIAAAEGGSCVLPSAQQLGMEEDRLQKARNLLVLYQVCADTQGPKRPRKELEYDPAELKQARTGDEAFAGLCQYYEGALGRIMRKSEMEILYSVYSGLGMPAEVLMLLVNYCASRQRLTPRFFEKEAYQWSQDGVETYAQAEQYLANLQQRYSRQGEIMRLLGIQDRRLSESERQMVDKWITYGYGTDLIALAYDRTALRTGGLKWAYLDSILESWRAAGYRTRAEVEAQEGQSPARQEQRDQKGQPVRRGEFESGIVAIVTKQYERKRMQREQLQQTRLEDLRKRNPSFAENEKALRLCASRAARAAAGGDQKEVARLRQQNQQLLEVRSVLLQGLGYDETYLDPPPDCPKCRDQGYIGAEMCQCFREACQREQARQSGGRQ